MPKIQPAQRNLYFLITPSSGAFSENVDIAKCLSVVNRRLYRQGMQYLVESVTMQPLQLTTLSALNIKTAGDTWMVHNAWKKAFNLWKKQRAEAQQALPGISGKWADFKVALDDNDTGASLMPRDGNGDVFTCDEWALSEVFWDDDGTEQSPTFRIIGATDPTSAIGMIQEYHISRVRPDAFNPDVDDDASDSIYAKMLPMQDELSDQLIGDIEDDNDNPPYDLDQMVGGDTEGDYPFIQDILISQPSMGKAVSVPFTAECGLIRLTGGQFLASDGTTANDTPIAVQITVAPGAYKGVAAVPMGQ